MTTPLRQKLMEDLQLRGLSGRTRETYIREVQQFAEYYRKSPDQITEAELRAYFLYLLNEKQVASSTLTVALSGIKFFYVYTLQRAWTTFELVRAPKEKKLPIVLTIDEVRLILSCVKIVRYQVCLSTIYGCGLRLQEGIQLAVGDIYSQRMVVHVQRGKGTKERVIRLNGLCRKVIRAWYAVRPAGNLNQVFITQRGSATTRAIQSILENVGEAAHVENLPPHVARHTFAKNLGNAGINLEKVAMLLGHFSLDTTLIYTTPAMRDLENAVSVLDS